ncbi:MAG: hypothetical protein HY887_01765 [Deltaproteobacteria bacterium]|nr:hypothetical protein [Deltaproteobacteria bacterium]
MTALYLDRKAALAFLLTVIALNVIFAAFVKGPLNEELVSIEARIDGLKRLDENLLGLPVRVRTQTGKSGPRIRKGIPHNQKGMGPLLTDILAAARDNGLEIQEAEYNRTVGGRRQDAYTLSFPVKGSYGQVKKFIFSLETMGHQIEVDEISLAGAALGEALAVRLGIHMPKAEGL